MNIDWTHKGVKITDIRKVRKFYVISIDDKKITSPLFVDHSIFEGRVNSYYLRGFNDSRDRSLSFPDMTRDEVMNIKWNMVINKGYFIKLIDGREEEVHKDHDKYYTSFIEIEGTLGNNVSN
jgi:hypothetical protein